MGHLKNSNYLNAKCGIGLREPHYSSFLSTKPDVGFVEVHSENFFNQHTTAFMTLLEVSKQYPVSLHSIGLSLGSASGLSKDHLTKLRTLIDVINPRYVSEHVSWSGIQGKHVPDLLPMPFTKESLSLLIDHISEYQDFIGRQILVENPSSYLTFKDSDYEETEFINLLAERTGCGLLLDINNIYVSAYNTGFDAKKYLQNIDHSKVQEIHLAGFQINEFKDSEILVDAHNHPVYEPVWELFRSVVPQFIDTDILIEWDRDIPELDVLLAEAEKVNQLKSKHVELA